MLEQDVRFFTIQEAAEASGLSAHTIRAWEKRYKALTPVRSDTGRRKYSTQEIHRLKLLAQLTGVGSAIRQIAHLSDTELKEAYGRLMKTQMNPLIGMNDQDINFDLEACRNSLIENVKKYEMGAIHQELQQARAHVTPKTFAFEILKPLHDLVEEGLSADYFQEAQRFAFYALARSVAGTIINTHYGQEFKSSSRIVLASLDYEQMVMESLLMALICCDHQKNLVYLNPNLPARSITEAAVAVEANLILLHIAPYFKEADARNYIQHLINDIGPKQQLWILGKPGFPKFFQESRQLRFLGSLNQLDLELGELV